MTALEFLTYCAGISTIIVSTGVAIRLGRPPPAPAVRIEQAALVEPPEPASNVLAARMQQLQEARYASPIVRRALPQDAVPLRRGAHHSPEVPLPRKEG